MTGIIRLFVVTIIAATAAWLAGSCLVPNPAWAGEKRLLWQSREQFVALEPREGDPVDPAQQNGHPATLTAEQLTTLLSPLQLKREGEETPEPLFTPQSLETLTPHLVLGLRKATAGEDLTFAVIGLHKTMLGLVKEPRVTTGRLFIRDGKLNLIVGLAQRDVNEREDRRLAPFTPGSRATAAPGEWLLQPPAQPTGYTLVRRDWVSVATGWQPPVTQTVTPPLPVPAPQPVQAAPLHQRVPARSPAERLTTLKELHDRGLISDDEFQSKRQQILNEL